jgi:peptidoglycan biosynthesis protein MviN/MurJ (putative lipid II flippase)
MLKLLIVILFTGIGIVFFTGNGEWLIAGYNTKTREEKDQYNSKMLCRFVGILMFVIAGSMALNMLGEYMELQWLRTSSIPVGIVITMGAIVFMNTKYFKK